MIRSLILAVLCLSLNAAEREEFTLKDGRHLVGTYDADAGILAMEHGQLAIAKDEIVERKAAAKEAIEDGPKRIAPSTRQTTESREEKISRLHKEIHDREEQIKNISEEKYNGQNAKYLEFILHGNLSDVIGEDNASHALNNQLFTLRDERKRINTVIDHNLRQQRILEKLGAVSDKDADKRNAGSQPFSFTNTDREILNSEEFVKSYSKLKGKPPF